MAHAYTEQPWSGGRLVGLFGAIAVNVVLFAAISTGLDFDVIQYEPPFFVVVPVPVEPVVPPAPQPVPVPGVVDRTPHVLYVPPVFPDFPSAPAEGPPVPGTADPLPPEPVSAPPATQLQVDPRFPLAKPIYPPPSIRRGEQGVVTLLILVTPDGRVADVRIKRSSGFHRLDEAAVTAARKEWRFQPATQGGSPVAAWGIRTVVFELTGEE